MDIYVPQKSLIYLVSGYVVLHLAIQRGLMTLNSGFKNSNIFTLLHTYQAVKQLCKLHPK